MRRLLAAAVLLTAAYAHAEVERAEVSWLHPLSYTDGTVLSPDDITLTEIEYWSCPTDETIPAATTLRPVPAPDTSVTIAPLEPGRWCFRARTWVNTGPNPSDWTGVAVGTVTPGELLIIFIEARP